MMEGEAKAWIAEALIVPRDKMVHLEQFANMLIEENQQQNLIARSTIEHLWSRHIADSAQLARYLPAATESTIMDLGTGSGLPGLVLAIMGSQNYLLVESRRRRCAFLVSVIETLQLSDRVEVLYADLRKIDPSPVSAITARAFAPLMELIDMARPFSDASTRWVLPRGEKGVKEWQELPRRYKALFHVEQSLTSERAVILVGEGAA